MVSGLPPSMEKEWSRRPVPWTLLCGGTIFSGGLLALLLARWLLALFP